MENQKIRQAQLDQQTLGSSSNFNLQASHFGVRSVVTQGEHHLIGDCYYVPECGYFQVCDRKTSVDSYNRLSSRHVDIIKRITSIAVAPNKEPESFQMIDKAVQTYSNNPELIHQRMDKQLETKGAGHIERADYVGSKAKFETSLRNQLEIKKQIIQQIKTKVLPCTLGQGKHDVQNQMPHERYSLQSQKLQETELEKKEIKEKLEKLQQDTTVLRYKLKMSQGCFESASRELKINSVNLDNANTLIEQQKKQISKLNEELEKHSQSAIQEYQKQVATLTKEKKDLQHDIKEMIKEIEKYKGYQESFEKQERKTRTLQHDLKTLKEQQRQNNTPAAEGGAEGGDEASGTDFSKVHSSPANRKGRGKKR